jgi:hypothetical protein
VTLSLSEKVVDETNFTNIRENVVWPQKVNQQKIRKIHNILKTLSFRTILQATDQSKMPVATGKNCI